MKIQLKFGEVTVAIEDGGYYGDGETFPGSIAEVDGLTRKENSCLETMTLGELQQLSCLENPNHLKLVLEMLEYDVVRELVDAVNIMNDLGNLTGIFELHDRMLVTNWIMSVCIQLIADNYCDNFEEALDYIYPRTFSTYDNKEDLARRYLEHNNVPENMVGLMDLTRTYDKAITETSWIAMPDGRIVTFLH